MPGAMHNAEKPDPPVSLHDTGGQGGLRESSNTRVRNSLRAVNRHRERRAGVHGEGVRKYILFDALRLRFRLVASDFPGNDGRAHLPLISSDRLLRALAGDLYQ